MDDELTWWQEIRQHVLFDIVITAVLALIVVIVVQRFVVKAYNVPSGSMEQTIQINDRILVGRFVYYFEDPTRGDIIVFHPNPYTDAAGEYHSGKDPYIKRLIGLPGEWIGALDGKVYICDPSLNGVTSPTAEGCQVLDEPYVASAERDFGPLRLREDQYFMMGDNRSNSEDSRVWGPIHRDQMIGPMLATYWPLERAHSF